MRNLIIFALCSFGLAGVAHAQQDSSSDWKKMLANLRVKSSIQTGGSGLTTEAKLIELANNQGPADHSIADALFAFASDQRVKPALRSEMIRNFGDLKDPRTAGVLATLAAPGANEWLRHTAAISLETQLSRTDISFDPSFITGILKQVQNERSTEVRGALADAAASWATRTQLGSPERKIVGDYLLSQWTDPRLPVAYRSSLSSTVGRLDPGSEVKGAITLLSRPCVPSTPDLCMQGLEGIKGVLEAWEIPAETRNSYITDSWQGLQPNQKKMVLSQAIGTLASTDDYDRLAAERLLSAISSTDPAYQNLRASVSCLETSTTVPVTAADRLAIFLPTGGLILPLSKTVNIPKVNRLDKNGQAYKELQNLFLHDGYASAAQSACGTNTVAVRRPATPTVAKPPAATGGTAPPPVSSANPGA